jgi:hypothetical protein
MLEIYTQSITLHRLRWTVWTFDASADEPVSITETAENKRGDRPIDFAEFL